MCNIAQKVAYCGSRHVAQKVAYCGSRHVAVSNRNINKHLCRPNLRTSLLHGVLFAASQVLSSRHVTKFFILEISNINCRRVNVSRLYGRVCCWTEPVATQCRINVVLLSTWHCRCSWLVEEPKNPPRYPFVFFQIQKFRLFPRTAATSPFLYTAPNFVLW